MSINVHSETECTREATTLQATDLYLISLAKEYVTKDANDNRRSGQTTKDIKVKFKSEDIICLLCADISIILMNEVISVIFS